MVKENFDKLDHYMQVEGDLSDFQEFLKKNQELWKQFNTVTGVGSMIGAILCGLAAVMNDVNCAGIGTVTWGLFLLNLINSGVSWINISEHAEKFWKKPILTGYAIFNIVMILWASITYFSSMEQDCISKNMGGYLFLMF